MTSVPGGRSKPGIEGGISIAEASIGPANDPHGLAGVAVGGGGAGVAVVSGVVEGASG